MLRIVILGWAIVLTLGLSVSLPGCGFQSASPPAPSPAAPSLSPLSPAITPGATPNLDPSSNPEPPAELVQDLRSILTLQTGIPESDVQLQSFQAQEWADACLGVESPDELCAQVITSGYRLVFASPEGEHVFHTDRTGRNYRLLP